MMDISEDQLRRLLQIKLSYNSLVDLQDANLYEIRIALNEVIKELISENQTNSNTDISSRLYIVSFELMVENLFEDYIEKLICNIFYKKNMMMLLIWTMICT